MNTTYLTSEQMKVDGHAFVDLQAEILRKNLKNKKSQDNLIQYV